MSTIHKQGRLNAEKVLYDDGIGCCVWYPFTDKPDDEDVGICFDFDFSDIDDFIRLLQTLKTVESDIFKE